MVMRKVIFLIALAGLLALVSGTTAWADESQGFVRMLQSNNIFVRIEAAKLVEGLYLLDPKVYPVVEERLRQRLREGHETKEHLDEAGWLCKALASSGDLTHAKILNVVMSSAKSKKVRQYAKQALAKIPEFAVRNELLLKTPGDPALSFVDNRLLRMLRSGDFSLQRNAAKRISRSSAAPAVVYQELAAVLDAHLQRDDLHKLRFDTMGWICKALASSGELQYVGVLRRALSNAPTEKLRQHARDGLRLLGDVAAL